MKPLLNFMRAVERDMGWVQIRYHDANGNTTHVEHLGDDTKSPLASQPDDEPRGFTEETDPDNSGLPTGEYDKTDWGV